MLNLKKFTDVGVNFDAKISIRPSGMMGVSSGALRRFKLLDDRWSVVMFYDKEARVVGIKPTMNRDEQGATKLVVRDPKPDSTQKQPSGHFSAKSFLQHHNIPYRGKHAQSFEAAWSAEHDMILIDLKKPKNGPKVKPESVEGVEEECRQTPKVPDGNDRPF